MIGCVVVTRTFTPSARLFLAFSKSWLLHASTCARAMPTAPLRHEPVDGRGRQAQTPFCPVPVDSRRVGESSSVCLERSCTLTLSGLALAVLSVLPLSIEAAIFARCQAL